MSPNQFEGRRGLPLRLPVAMRAKHAKPVFPYDPWRQSRGRIAKGAACALLAGTLMFPNAAFAAEWVNVGGTQYDSAYADEAAGWSWDGADDLNLNGYNGGAISAEGDLNVKVSGENRAASDEWGAAVEVVNGDLSISGDGSLAAEGGGIHAEEGDVTIDGTTVTVNSDGTGGYAQGITAANGDVTIKNGADVSVSVKGPESADGIAAIAYGEGYGGTGKGGNISISDSTVKVDVESGAYSDAFGIYAEGTESSGGTISIANSTVEVSARVSEDGELVPPYDPSPYAVGDDGYYDGVPGDGGYEEDSPYYGDSYGIMASSSSKTTPATISVDRSTVIAEATTAAMLAFNYAEGIIPVRGQITIKNSKLVTPEGGIIKDFDYDREYSVWAATDDATDYATHFRGQMIAGPKGNGTNEWNVAKKAVIVPVEQEAPSLIEKAYASTGEAGLAKTGDAAGTLAGAAVAVAAVAAAAGATAVVRSRKHD